MSGEAHAPPRRSKARLGERLDHPFLARRSVSHESLRPGGCEPPCVRWDEPAGLALPRSAGDGGRGVLIEVRLRLALAGRGGGD